MEKVKLAGRHQSLTEPAEKLLRFLDGSLRDLKVSPGIIISKRSSKKRNRRIKVNVWPGGLDITVTHNATVQKLRIYTPHKDLVTDLIQQYCRKEKIDYA